MSRVILIALCLLLAASLSHAQVPPRDANGVIDLGGREIAITRTADVPGGTTIRNGTIRLSGADLYALRLAPGASDVRLVDLRLIGGGLRCGNGPMHDRITIERCEFVGWSTGGVGGAVYMTSKSRDVTIRHNIFRDAHASWGIQMYYSDRLTIERNTFQNLMQGAHLLNIYNDSKILYNKVVGMQRMGFEIQDLNWTQDAPMRNLLVEGNVLYGWRNIYHESFGLSVVRQNSINTRVINNYIRIDGTVRPGIGLEFSARTDGASQGNQSIVSGNTIIGNWFGFVAHYWPEQRVQNNKFWGTPWPGSGYILAWKGHGGTPNNNQATGNVIVASTAGAPQPPTDVGAGSGGDGTPPSPTGVTVAAKAVDRATVELTGENWPAGWRVQWRGSREPESVAWRDIATITSPTTRATMPDQQVEQTWELVFRLLDRAGAERARSGSIQIGLLPPATQPATQPTPPPATQPVTIETTVRLRLTITGGAVTKVEVIP